MITEINGKKVELYDSIESMPIVRFHKYNKMLLIDAGIGSDLGDFDRHIERALIYIRGKDTSKAVSELENLRQNVYFIQSGISPKNIAFAVLVKSIDGKPNDDLSDEALTKVCETLSGASKEELTEQTESVKKKIDEELKLYFPKLFEDATLKEYYDQLKARTMLILKTIIAEKPTEEEAQKIDSITEKLITYFNPDTFSGSDGLEVRHDRNFENMCLIISKSLHADPKKFTVLEFYNAFEYIRDEARENKRLNKK